MGIDVSKGYADFVIINQQKQPVVKGFQLDDTFKISAVLNWEAFGFDFAIEIRLSGNRHFSQRCNGSLKLAIDTHILKDNETPKNVKFLTKNG